MISFEQTKEEKELQRMANEMALKYLRPVARYYDEYDHEHDDIKETDEIIKAQQGLSLKSLEVRQKTQGKGADLLSMILMEEANWGDAGLSLGATNAGLGNAAIMAVATPEQSKKFGGQYTAMAITEPCCGSDSASIQATAKLDPDTNEWVLNGEKIFVTGADRCKAVVVWASLDRTKGRSAIKSFIVPKGTPGFTQSKLEDKLGIRASDTGSFILEDCRVPYESILGSPEIVEKSGGFNTLNRLRDYLAGPGAEGPLNKDKEGVMMKRTVLIVVVVLVLVPVVLYVGFPRALVRFAIDLERKSAGLSKGSVLIGDHTVYYLEGGEGETILLVHGFGANKDNWNRLAKYLTPSYHVVAVDLPGFGESTKREDSSYSIAAQVERLDKIAEALSLNSFHVAGNSMGGNISGKYAARFPEKVLSLGLFNSGGVATCPERSELSRLLEQGENPLLVETPEDFESFLKNEPRLDGYVGGSSAERFPIEESVPRVTANFKSVKRPKAN